MSQPVSDFTPPASADELLAALDPEQREVATALDGPVCVLAGAGTGKTRAITHRIAYGVRTGTYDPATVLAVTFTTRAAGEMRGAAAPGSARAACRPAPSTPPRCGRPATSGPRCTAASCRRSCDRKFPLLAEAASRCRLRVDTAGLAGPGRRDRVGEGEQRPRRTTTPPVAPRGGRRWPGSTPARWPGSSRRTRRSSASGAGSTWRTCCCCAVALLAEDERVAAEIRRQYRLFVVDEYQDVSPLQQRLLDLWLGGRDSVCVVGDPAQTIYSFAGADPDYLLGSGKRHPAATMVRLVRNYRSTPQVVAVANKVLDAAGPGRAGRPG